jgi:hypothetical protein
MPPTASDKPNSGRNLTVPVERLQLREQFPLLLLANPNHFGTLLESDLPVAAPIQGDTGFEQLTCVGLNPALDQAEAVVRVNGNGGYGGTLCSGGSMEYVRFYASYDGGVSWIDLGMDSFTVHDSSGARPLDYAVNLPVPVQHRWCFLDNQPTLRAILSWSQPPTANTPEFPPIWGNVLDVRVQPTSSKLLFVGDLVEVLEAKLPDPIGPIIDLEQPLEIKSAPILPLVKLAAAYQDKDVAPHRFVFPHIQQALLAATTPQNAPAILGAQVSELSELAKIKIDLFDILAQLAKIDGDTDFEELGCIGYDPVEDALVGVVTVKKSLGYSGGPCTAGSIEYVAFWLDWGSGFEYAGTASVRVHDQAVPDGGLRFSVYLPVSTFSHRGACVDGPVQPTVRAILSWEAPPPPSNPNWIPTWGNREQTTIQLAPGVVVALRPVVDSVGGVPVCSIDQSDGRTIGADQPFGGNVRITGFIPGAPDIGAAPMKYRVRVRDVDNGGTFTALTNPFWIAVTKQVGSNLPDQSWVPQTTDPDNYYTYLEDPNNAGTGWRRVVDNVLAEWTTAAPMTGTWEIEVVAKDPLGTIYFAQTVLCTDGTTRTNVRVRLDEVKPTSTFTITDFIRNGVSNPAEECMKFKVGDVLTGAYSVTDEHFRLLIIDLQPSGPAMGREATPSVVSFPTVPTSGTSGTWQLDTSLMASCGYVLTLRAWDRTIVSSNANGWEAEPHKVIGFSLEN